MDERNHINRAEEQANPSPPGRALTPLAPNNSKTIVVNGRSHRVLADEIGRRELMALAFPNALTGDPGALTIAYDNGPSESPSGLIGTDRAVRVLDGQTFSVTLTDKS